jgi:hypothetical protein
MEHFNKSMDDSYIDLNPGLFKRIPIIDNLATEN